MNLFDEESEQIIIGSILQSPNIFNDISQILKPEDFFVEKHRIIYECISAEIDNQSNPDAVFIISSLKKNGLLEKAGNKTYLMHLADMGSVIGARNYAERVKEFSLRRNLHAKIKEFEKKTTDTSTDFQDLLSDYEKAIFSISDRFITDSVTHIKKVNDEFIEFLEKVKSSKDGISGAQTHFKRFDQITTGLKGGQLIILAARPGVGKTTLALNFAQNIAIRSKEPVLIFSLEMTRLQLMLRMVCTEAYLSSEKIQKGFISGRDMDKIMKSLENLYAADIYMDDSSGLSSWEFKQKTRRLALQLKKQNKKLGFIVVDYLQLMTEGGRMRESRQIEVAHISRSLKLIAKELNVPVLALSQMNRSIEQRGRDSRPQLSDLRESGAIEQDADIVMFIHREDLNNPDINESERDQAELIIAKHRAGPTDLIKLAFDKDKSFFSETDKREDPGEPVHYSVPL
ncbi:MAG: replicative DNA helicase [Spirochaetia bacterium]|nr:replicative DNA helicase [Spirochaetia bacterium]